MKKLIPVDLSKKQALDASPKATQQINLFANLERAGNTHNKCTLLLKKSKKRS